MSQLVYDQENIDGLEKYRELCGARGKGIIYQQREESDSGAHDKLFWPVEEELA